MTGSPSVALDAKSVIAPSDRFSIVSRSDLKRKTPPDAAKMGSMHLATNDQNIPLFEVSSNPKILELWQYLHLFLLIVARLAIFARWKMSRVIAIE